MRYFSTDGVISARCYRPGDELALFDAVTASLAELIRWGFYHPAFTLEDALKDVASTGES